MNKIIEFFSSELWFWINLFLGLIGIFLWILNWILMRVHTKREYRKFIKKVPFASTLDFINRVEEQNRLLGPKYDTSKFAEIYEMCPTTQLISGEGKPSEK